MKLEEKVNERFNEFQQKNNKMHSIIEKKVNEQFNAFQQKNNEMNSIIDVLQKESNELKADNKSLLDLNKQLQKEISHLYYHHPKISLADKMGNWNPMPSEGFEDCYSQAGFTEDEAKTNNLDEMSMFDDCNSQDC